LSSLFKNSLVKKFAAGLAVKEIVDRVQEARQPRKSFLRRHSGKIALLALAGGGYYVWQRSQVGPSLPSQRPYEPTQRREPAIEPGERLETPLRASETSTIDTTSESPTPAGR
jgi:hypothetical protein